MHQDSKENINFSNGLTEDLSLLNGPVFDLNKDLEACLDIGSINSLNEIKPNYTQHDVTNERFHKGSSFTLNRPSMSADKQKNLNTHSKRNSMTSLNKLNMMEMKQLPVNLKAKYALQTSSAYKMKPPKQ